MIIWRPRALISVSAAAILVAIVPFRNDAVHELRALKRIAEDRMALAAASMLSVAALPRDAWELGQNSFEGWPLPVQREVKAASAAILEPSEPPPAAAPEASPQTAPKPEIIPPSPAALAYRKGDAAALSALAKAASDPDERLGLEWAALRTDPHPSDAALAAFTAFLKDEPAPFKAESDEAKRDQAALAMTATFTIGQILQGQQKFDEAIAAYKGYLAKFPNGLELKLAHDLREGVVAVLDAFERFDPHDATLAMLP